MRRPDYTQLLKVLNKQAPDRPTLFEFFLNDPLHRRLEQGEAPVRNDGFDSLRRMIYAFKNAGYDYVTLHGSDFGFPTANKAHKSTLSLNEGFVITDWDSYERYQWPEPETFDYSRIDTCAADLPEGMKFVMYGPSGVLENTIALAGYDNLCIMLYDDPDLAKQIFDDVGSRLVRYYQQVIGHDSVCAMISNDDWGFKTQTMLSPDDMRKYVFPWHKKIIEVGHQHHKPVILHSCGALGEVMEDVIEDMRFDAKHSFEDNIQPVEEAYACYKGRIALLGGMDVNFVCTATPEAIAARARKMIDLSATDGGYALGTGNSVPEYVPVDNYLAMIDVVRHG